MGVPVRQRCWDRPEALHPWLPHLPPSEAHISWASPRGFGGWGAQTGHLNNSVMKQLNGTAELENRVLEPPPDALSR